MKTPFVILLTIICLTGCSTTVWYQSSADPEQTRRDLARCHMDADTKFKFMPFNSFGAMASTITKGDYVKNCMLEKGYVPTPANQVSNAAAYPKQ